MNSKIQPARLMRGHELRRLMRRHKVTIKALSARMGITQKRIRQVLAAGLDNHHAVRDWIEGVTGADPGLLGDYPHSRLRVARLARGDE